MKRASLQVEVLEDRATPSTLQGLDVVPVQGPQAATSAEAIGVIADFAMENQGALLLRGESTVVDGAAIATWALVSPRDNTILAVGLTFSLKLAQEMPEQGNGPAGAIASLDYPALVRDATFFNHVQIHPQMHGHGTPPGSANPQRNSVPHFDFHYYAVSEEQVWGMPAMPPPLPAVPPDRLPAGYAQPGPSVLQMGRHSVPLWSLTDPNPLSTIMYLGYLPDGSQMHFLEPMISQEVLLARQDFTLPVPMPQDLGLASPTLYPTKFEALFQGNSWSFVYSAFVTVPSAASVVNIAGATEPVAAAHHPASNVPTDFSGLALFLAQARGQAPTAFLDVATPRSLLSNSMLAALVAVNSTESSEARSASPYLEDLAADDRQHDVIMPTFGEIDEDDGLMS